MELEIAPTSPKYLLSRKLTDLVFFAESKNTCWRTALNIDAPSASTLLPDTETILAPTLPLTQTPLMRIGQITSELLDPVTQELKQG